MTEVKIQKILRKKTPKLYERKYKVLYPTRLSPGNLTAWPVFVKFPKLVTVPVRHIVSNMNTATYHFAKHLSKISNLRQSEHNIKSTRHFVEIIKHKKVPEGFKLVSFDFIHNS